MTDKENQDFLRISAAIPGYAQHCAWRIQTYGVCRHMPPPGTTATRLVLRGMSLCHANLSNAMLAYADLTDVDFTATDLSNAHLYRTNLTGTILSSTFLGGAYIEGAIGIRSAGPVGQCERMIYGVAHKGGPMVQADYFWGSLPDAIGRINARYADGSGIEHLRNDYLAAIAFVGGIK